jgi:uncharacterized protein
MLNWPYTSPSWLPSGQAQTIWPALFSCSGRAPEDRHRPYRERWITPDADFIDVDMLHAREHRSGPPVLLCLFHGLEGSMRSHYARALALWTQNQGVDFALPHFRGCSGAINLAPRAYHSGDHEEVSWVLERLRYRFPAHRIVALGVSLGGNALMRWAAEVGTQACKSVDAVASVCSPIDLRVSGLAIGTGFNRLVYTPMFLRTMKPKAEQKWQQYPGLFDLQRMRASRDLYEFDDVFTGPLHGFSGVDDYWTRASAKPVLDQIRVPALVLNALNDPFVPAESLPKRVQGDWVQLCQPRHGGHVGFPAGAWPGHLQAMPDWAGAWLLKSVGLAVR